MGGLFFKIYTLYIPLKILKKNTKKTTITKYHKEWTGLKIFNGIPDTRAAECPDPADIGCIRS